MNTLPEPARSSEPGPAAAPEKTVWAVLLTVTVFANVPAAVPVLFTVMGPAKFRLLVPKIVTLLLLKVTGLLRVTPARAWTARDAEPAVVATSEVMVPPVRPAALTVIVGALTPARAFWKVIVGLAALETTVLAGPMFGSALSAAWMLVCNVIVVALQVMGPVVWP